MALKVSEDSLSFYKEKIQFNFYLIIKFSNQVNPFSKINTILKTHKNL